MTSEAETQLEPPVLERPGLLARLLVDVRPLRLPAFRRLWLGQAISLMGSMISFVAVPYQLYELTHSTLQVGLLAFADLVPLLTLALVGGAIADAVDRRRLLLVTEAGFALVSLALAGNAALAHPRIWALYVLAFLGAAFWCLGSPALRSLTPRLVPDDQLTAAVALNSVYGNLGAVAGPALGGLLVSVLGLTVTYLIDFGSFAASLVAIALLPTISPSHEAEPAGLRSLLEGLRFVRRQRAVLGIFLLDTNAMIFGMPSALFPAFAEHRFGAGAGTVGLLYGAPYAGALAASVVSRPIQRIRRQALAVALFAGAWGVALVGFGFSTALWLGLVFLALAGAADFVSAALRTTIVLQATPDEMRGRVSGIELAQVASAPTLGNVEAGLVASFTSLRFSVVSGGIACVVGTLALVAAIPEIVRYRADGRHR
jgi:MFS family permease